jgi:hypothetical protein
MMSDVDSDKQECIDAMGPELGPVFFSLWKEVAQLHSTWHEFVTLFGTKASRVDLMNQAASSFFGLVENTLWEHTLLHIGRLTDDPKKDPVARLSLLQLPKLVLHVKTRDKVKALIAEAETKCEFARGWRNRWIAHRNLDHALDKSAHPLPRASRLQVREALASIADVLNAVGAHYRNTTTRFDLDDSVPGGAWILLRVVKQGVQAQQDTLEKVKRNEAEPRVLDFSEL